MRSAAFYALAFLTAGLASTVTARAELEYTFHNSGELRILVVSGMFSPYEPIGRFEQAVERYQPSVVTFDSGGGSIMSAMELGRKIRSLGLNTIQARQLECASACSLAFLGGVQRAAAPGSIGVHRSSFDASSQLSRDEAVASVQQMTAEILGYLAQMDVSPDLLGFAYRYDQNDIRYLSASEMQELRVTNANPAPDVASPPQPPVAALETKQFGKLEAYELVRGLIEEHGSGTSSALQIVRRIYAPSLSYYGHQKSLVEVLDDKKNYFERWPERAYRIRPDTLEIMCSDIQCTVSGVYDWAVRSTARNRQADGAAKFFYEIKLGQTPQITVEAGFVLK